MSTPGPRRPATSRGGVQRPRKIAGAPTARAEESSPADRLARPGGSRPQKQEKHEKPDAPRSARTRPGATEPSASALLTSARTTRVLTAALGVLALLLAALAVVWAIDSRDDDGAAPRRDRPVQADTLAVQAGVDAAAKAAEAVSAIDYKKYDEDVAAAAKLLTSPFAKEFRTTADEVKKEYIDLKTVVRAPVVAQGVVTASSTRLQALLFVNQETYRVRSGTPERVVTQYAMLVTMVHTDQGWLASHIDTDIKQDGERASSDESTPPDDSKK